MDPGLVCLMTDLFNLSKVKEGETVLVFENPMFSGAPLSEGRPPAYYNDAFRIAAENLGARMIGIDIPSAAMKTGTGMEEFFSGMADLMKNADLIVNSDLYQTAHTKALMAGARSIMIGGPTSAQKRLRPTPEVRRLSTRGAEFLQKGKKIRMTNKYGTDLTLDKTGRKGTAGYGAADEPGRWDNSQCGQVGCAPLEDSANGTLVIAPGDGLIPLGMYATSPIKCTLKDGRITKFEVSDGTGKMFEWFLKKFKDERSLTTSHIGWGTNRGADWNAGFTEKSGMDWEVGLGMILFAFGINNYDSPAKLNGLGGKNDAPSHFDIGMRNISFYVDDELVLDGEKEELVHAVVK